MKKAKSLNKVLIITASSVIIIALLVIGILTFSKANYYKLALDNIAEARFYMKQDESTKIKVQFFSGLREDPYEINGVAEKTTAFAIINVEPKDNSLSGYLELKGTLKIDEELIDVTLDKNPYDKNFVADIERLIEVDQNIVFVLKLDNDTISFNLSKSMPDNAISWEDALKIATTAMTDKIKEAGKFECYVRIIYDLTKNSGSFWYVQFVPEDGKTFFCVISPSGEIIS